MEKPPKTKKRSPWLSRIASREEAAGMIRECVFALLFLAVVQLVFSFFYGYSLLIHAALLASGSFFLWRWRSKTAALLLLLYALIALGLTFAIHAGFALEGNRNISLALITLWTTIKAVEATQRWSGRFALPARPLSNEQT